MNPPISFVKTQSGSCRTIICRSQGHNIDPPQFPSCVLYSTLCLVKGSMTEWCLLSDRKTRPMRHFGSDTCNTCCFLQGCCFGGGGGGSCAKTERLWLCQYLWLVLIYLFIAENEGGGAETSPILLLSLNHSRYQIHFTKQINLNIFGHRCTYSLTPIHKHTFIYKRIHTYSNIYQKKSLQQQPNNCFISIQAFH